MLNGVKSAFGGKKLLKRFAVGALFLLMMTQLVPIETFALETPAPIVIPPPEHGFTDIAHVIGNLSRIVFIIALILVFFYFIYGGIRWIISGGDKAQTEAA